MTTINGLVYLTPHQLELKRQLDENWRPPLLVLGTARSMQFLVHWICTQLQRDHVTVHILDRRYFGQSLLEIIQGGMAYRHRGFKSCVHEVDTDGTVLTSCGVVNDDTPQEVVHLHLTSFQTGGESSFCSTTLAQMAHSEPKVRACEAEAAKQLEIHLIPDLADIVLDYVGAPRCERKRKAEDDAAMPAIQKKARA